MKVVYRVKLVPAPSAKTNIVDIGGNVIKTCDAETLYLNIIGWCMKHGKKSILCDDFSTVSFDRIDELIKRIEVCLKNKNKVFQEYVWKDGKWELKENEQPEIRG